MIDTLCKFQCPDCKCALTTAAACCLACGRAYADADGILDFVGGRFTTQLDTSGYDASHGIDDHSSEFEYQRLRHTAAHRWPASLGSVVEIGCGTGSFSRAMIGHREAADVVLTDVSTDMLRICVGHLDRLGIGTTLPVRFATYSANEPCFCDAVFDTCIGTSVVHHITDVRAFLGDVWRFLKPGGQACFVEPSLRYHRVVAMAFADIIALLLARDPEFTPERQALHNWVAEGRRGVMLQGDVGSLAGYEDKHMFIGDEFAALALEAGFDTAEALPLTPDPTGLEGIGGLLAGLGVGEQFGRQVMRLWPSYANRYLPLLNARDLSLGYQFWLTKSAQPRSAAPHARPEPAGLVRSSEAAITGGGMPLRWAITLAAETAPAGMRLKLDGWCLANADIKSIRTTLDGVARQTPVWLPRADVHLALNRDGRYAAWNSLCCGFDGEMLFDVAHTTGRQLAVNVDVVFADGCFVPMVTGEMLRPGVPYTSGR
jgi:2-polyprenyl-3-methyl-5-hydroxy-6-metoxy-1,4-benzoquinol methylase